MRIAIAALIVWLFLPLDSFPQLPLPTDTIVLPIAEIAASPLRNQAAGARAETWSREDLEAFQSHHLGELLSRQGGVYVKSYGLGSSATTSMRGAGAGHATVLWNGLPLQSPMLGQLDFSLLPMVFIDAVELQYGGNTAAWGSGAIGGVISLKNQGDIACGSSLLLRATIGSFGFFEQQFKADYGKGAWSGTTRLLHQRAANDFPYRPAPGLPEQTLDNAALRQTGFMQEINWRPSPKGRLALHLWAQQTDRQIPPTLVQNASAAIQEDAFLRAAIHWKNIGKKVVWQARAGAFRERLDYRDSQIGLESLSRYWVLTAEAEGEWRLNDRQRLQFGLGHTWLQAEAGAYKVAPQQNRTAPFAAFRQQWGRWQAQLNLRQELVDGNLAPLAPGFGLEGQLYGWLSFHAKVTRNYRLPTFNDLYWQPGGNPDLLPESGWSQEAALQSRWKKNRHHWTYSLSGFTRRIDNWILWSPQQGMPFWSPDNLARVWSRGLENRLNWTYTAEKWKARLSGGYDFIRSTNEIAIQTPRLDAGEQLLYVPVHQAFAAFTLHWKTLHAEYRRQYTGPVSAINVDVLPGYSVDFLYLALPLRRDSFETLFFLNLHNVWNETYQVVERRPMPGRWLQGGIQLRWHKSEKK